MSQRTSTQVDISLVDQLEQVSNNLKKLNDIILHHIGLLERIPEHKYDFVDVQQSPDQSIVKMKRSRDITDSDLCSYKLSCNSVSSSQFTHKILTSSTNCSPANIPKFQGVADFTVKEINEWKDELFDSHEMTEFRKKLEIMSVGTHVNSESEFEFPSPKDDELISYEESVLRSPVLRASLSPDELSSYKNQVHMDRAVDILYRT